jgi:hypothetical protein
LVIAVGGRVGIGINVDVELGLRVMPAAGVLAAVEVGVLDSLGNDRVVEGRFGLGKLSLKIIGIDRILYSSPINAQLPRQSRSMIPKVFLRLSFTIVCTNTSFILSSLDHLRALGLGIGGSMGHSVVA